jgi:hypothetical protein
VRVLNISVTSIIIMLSITPAGATDASNETHWSVTPYIWATETEFDLKAQGTPIGEDKITFDDLLDVTDASFKIVVEAGGFNVLVGLRYTDLDDVFDADIVVADERQPLAKFDGIGK